MKKISHKGYTAIKLCAVLTIVSIAAGCAGAKTPPIQESVPASPGEAIVTYAEDPTTVGSVLEIPALRSSEAVGTISLGAILTQWTVASGNSLWSIAGNADVYNASDQWPLVYKNNIDQIDDPDLIFPGQVLNIPERATLAEIETAVAHARGRGAWAIGSLELSDQEYLEKSEE